VITLADRLKELQQYEAQLQRAKSVIVAGGGFTGVELVGELSDRLNVPKVTLITRSGLLTSMPPDAEKYALEWMSKKSNVEVIRYDEVSGPPTDGIYTTKKGRRLEADLLIDCTFQRPVVTSATITAVHDHIGNEKATTASVQGKEAISPYNSRGKVVVNENMQVKMYPFHCSPMRSTTLMKRYKYFPRLSTFHPH
jgi:NADH dehydrogenase FAD-containing subunit